MGNTERERKKEKGNKPRAGSVALLTARARSSRAAGAFLSRTIRRSWRQNSAQSTALNVVLAMGPTAPASSSACRTATMDVPPILLGQCSTHSSGTPIARHALISCTSGPATGSVSASACTSITSSTTSSNLSLWYSIPSVQSSCSVTPESQVTHKNVWKMPIRQITLTSLSTHSGKFVPCKGTNFSQIDRHPLFFSQGLWACLSLPFSLVLFLNNQTDIFSLHSCSFLLGYHHM